MQPNEMKIYIEDAFRYLVCQVGTCQATYHEDPYFTTEPYWTVAINGRLFTQIKHSYPTAISFECKTESGKVEVSFNYPKVR